MRRWIQVAAVALAVAACGGGRWAGGEDPSGEVLVSAAASLTDAFVAIEVAFEAAHDGVDVVLNTGGSSALREQILEGAPVDVFASAGWSDMDRVTGAGRTATAPDVLATNALQIAVPAGNPADVSGLEAFADESLLIGLCEEAVPCGDLARRALRSAGVTPAPDTNEPDVRALLTKIAEGELDAGIVYVTDVTSTDAVDGIDIPEGHNVVVEYPIATIAAASNPGAADAFVAFVLSDAGREILRGYGFSSP